MNVDASLVRHVAHLARIELTDEEVETYARQLADVVAYVEKLGEVSTDGVEPTAHPLSVRNVLRDDEPRPTLPIEDVMRNAPDRRDRCFRVPKVLDHNGTGNDP